MRQITFSTKDARCTFEPGRTVFEMAMAPDGGDWQTLMEGRYKPA